MIPKISPRDRSCLNCDWFQFNPDRPAKLNRECMCPQKISTRGGVCQQWKDMRTLWQRITGKTPMKAFC